MSERYEITIRPGYYPPLVEGEKKFEVVPAYQLDEALARAEKAEAWIEKLNERVERYRGGDYGRAVVEADERAEKAERERDELRRELYDEQGESLIEHHRTAHHRAAARIAELEGALRDGAAYLRGEDVAGWDAHMRNDEVAERLSPEANPDE